ncbi:MAG: DUF1549 domain-containing protein, partial [Pirellulaceae bacterium]|nr:DUF1549 domain-containing protein [Pirellulaceae bacterium]
MNARRRSCLIWLLLLLAASLPEATSSTARAAGVSYADQIKPLLAEKCWACHGALKQESGLRLDASQLIRQGGDSGPAIVAGQPQASLLLERVADKDPATRMPPAGEGEPLSAEQLTLLREWIEKGAVADEEPVPDSPQRHWAFQPPRSPDIPNVVRRDWVRNPLDALLSAHHERLGLTPAPAADPALLVRRLYFDLTGLPPTRAELHAFLDDTSPDAYERLVDRLLSSPRYGERWARHWMDVWRYSDWAGFGNEIRYSQKHIWRWRDWIVESLAADRGYDQMVREMLAADELAPGDEWAGRASGYLARNWYKFDRHTWLDETVEHTGRALLGMTLKCARCHDHKYDPISQEEYYRFRAIFEPYDVRTDQAAGQLDLERDGLVRVFDARPDAPTHLFERGDPKRADTSRSLPPGTPAVIAGLGWSVEPLTLPLAATYPALRPSVTRDLVSRAAGEVEAARRALAEAPTTLA